MAYETPDAKKHGLEFRFSDLPNYRGDSHWQYLQLDAYHKSEENPIGYLRVAFVSLEMGEGMNRERLLILQTKGHSVYPRPALRGETHTIFSNKDNWGSWKTEPERAARYVMETVMREPYSEWNRLLGEKNSDELTLYVEKHRPELNLATQEALEKMFSFAVNKADVDFISLNDNWQGRGLAQSFYKAMARYLDDTHGITLNASTTQTESALKCWLRMEQDGLISKADNGRMFVSKDVSERTLERRDIAPEPVAMPPKKRRASDLVSRIKDKRERVSSKQQTLGSKKNRRKTSVT